jgi:hypothetical protein
MQQKFFARRILNLALDFSAPFFPRALLRMLSLGGCMLQGAAASRWLLLLAAREAAPQL